MKYNKKLIDALLQGNDAYAASAHVRSGVYYSYETPIIVYPVCGLQEAVVDINYYSQTTSRQRNEVVNALKAKGVHIVETYGKLEV